MNAIEPDEEQRSRVFSRTPDGQVRSRLRPPRGGAGAEVERLRSLLVRSIRMIELQNARLRDHGLEPVTPAELEDPGDEGTIDLTRSRIAT